MTLEYTQQMSPYTGNDNYINEYNMLAYSIDNCDTLEKCNIVGKVLRNFISKHGTENVTPLSETLYEITYNLYKK